ncbi:alpha/beta fold hydrolase [Streptomyces sp. NPDC101160]|uniref:thioesterase domain-containing protein n=1 Tax=Streptomyces sp. NPDC101160 TaxID=3366118 RepID=UPI003825D303
MTTASPATSRLVILVRKKNRPTCVVLPGAGGGLQPYLRLAGYLGSRYNVYGVRTLGMVAGEEPETTVPEMADSVLATLDEQGLTPDLVVGWSMGGTLGWELSTRLAERGHRPDLVLIDTSPLLRESTPEADGDIEDNIVRQLGPHADEATRTRVLETFRAQVRALTEYETTTPYAGRVLLTMCTGDRMGPREEATERWRELAADLRTASLSATHFGVFDAEHFTELTEPIGKFLDLADPEAAR